MDLREIIKWFIPCFHILLKMDARMTLIWVLLFCNLCPGLVSASELEESNLNSAKNLVSYENISKLNQSEVYNASKTLVDEEFISRDTSVGRTFGRPMKKMMQALIPLAMAIGSAGTWAVVAALIGAKTLVVTLFILKLLLVAGAAKAMELIETGLKNKQSYNTDYNQPHYGIGHQNNQAIFSHPMGGHQNNQAIFSHPMGGHQNNQAIIPSLSMGLLPVHLKPVFGGLIASKTHQQPHAQPSKEIHLHIHNSQHGHEEEVIPNLTSWSRDSPASSISKTTAEAYNPYLYLAGPQTIRTPYGNYVKVD